MSHRSVDNYLTYRIQFLSQSCPRSGVLKVLGCLDKKFLHRLRGFLNLRQSSHGDSVQLQLKLHPSL
jgi:hypothetical protein